MSPSAAVDSTRDRIVGAAKAEFARYGIAGARVDRIAKNAKTGKERVYAYFRSKENLYRYIAAEELAAIAEATQMDPTDLPGYAGRIHDYFVAHRANYRLMKWGRLEFGGGGPGDPTRETIARKTEQLRYAQRAGHLDSEWDPRDILVFVDQLATAWIDQTDLTASIGSAAEGAEFLAARRAAIVAAVERLFPAANASGGWRADS
ncbi:TetR family transcriptional regulator [Nocardia sp. CA2R105]|uniref:TetR family transcriptional regulator n=1 Tax=Nocardia coffeae TaxID=2873381 RepID=UPI001CA68FF3|nr:TetR family transcriptional regulator [Nocardia coffeae]MBY8863758.1 TetR family transcriptional regulator [Nocardia coffeae]